MALPPGVRILDSWLNNTFPISSAPPRTPSPRDYRRTLWRVPVSDLQSICRSRHFPPHFPNLVSLFLTLSLTPHACFRKSRYGSVRPAGDHVSSAMYLSMYRGVRSLLRVNVRNATIRKRYTRCALAKTNLTLLYWQYDHKIVSFVGFMRIPSDDTRQDVAYKHVEFLPRVTAESSVSVMWGLDYHTRIELDGWGFTIFLRATLMTQENYQCVSRCSKRSIS